LARAKREAGPCDKESRIIEELNLKKAGVPGGGEPAPLTRIIEQLNLKGLRNMKNLKI
jgi:hypothetical protein